MALPMDSNTVSVSVHTKGVQSLIGGPKFDVVFLGFLTWYMVGSLTDFWAHNHIATLESFFTPWHGLLYSGYAATSLSLLVAVIVNRRRAGNWQNAIPAGYELTLLAIPGFFIGGVGDMFWHTAFGIERNVDAQFSPTHVILLIFGALLVSGPYRSAYQRTGQPRTLRLWLVTLYSIMIFFLYIDLITQIAHPYGHGYIWPTTMAVTNMDGQTRAVVSYLVITFILVGITLYTIRRWRLPFGSFLFVNLLVAVPLSFIRVHPLTTSVAMMAIGAISGLLTDCAYLWLKPSSKHSERFRLFAALVPLIFFGVFFLTLLCTETIIWSIHLSIGSVVATGVVGWLVSYMFIPGKSPAVEAQE